MVKGEWYKGRAMRDKGEGMNGGGGLRVREEGGLLRW